MLDCNPVSTPLRANFKPVKATDEEFSQAKQHPYAQVVGSILSAATVSRPDLAHAASVLSGYISKWNYSHWSAAKHLLRYIRGTLDLSLTFSDQPISLAFADADWGGNMDTCRSTTGYLFKVFGGAVAWRSRRQPTVALSTTEAEYMASVGNMAYGAFNHFFDRHYYHFPTFAYIFHLNNCQVRLPRLDE